MTHETTVQNMPANEGGRGNLAGFEIRCSCGWTMGTTLACDVPSIRREHVEYMTRRAVTVALTPNGFILRIKSIGGPEPADPFGFKSTGVL